jgi:beta-lactamase regulating signal transducer with metallopeptidase domain/5-hydroxyisourate hydrolase-like protein (transthyretin family)
MTPWIEAIALWMADFYLASTILLITACAALCFIKQPARRMAVSWGTLGSLLVAVVLCQLASRPRVDPRRVFARQGQLLARQEQPTVRGETTESQAAEPQAAEPPVSEISFAPRHAASPRQTDSEPPAEVGAEPKTAVKQPSGAEIDSQTIAGGAVLLFLTGALLMTARLAVGAWQASRLVRLSLTAPPALIDELQAIVGKTRLPRLRLHAQLVTPVATGALWPTIVLPEHFVKNSGREELRAVLGHEWAHIHNGDLWLLALDRCLFLLLWAHPAYWWLRRRTRQDQEILADAAAASLIGPADYAAQLVAWARDLAGIRRIIVSNAVGIWERPSGFALRISTILNHADRITLRCSGRVRVAVAGCLAAVSLIAASISVRPPNAESAPPEAEARPSPTEAPKATELQLDRDDIGGTCSEKGKPISGVDVVLYQLSYQLRFDDSDQRFVARTLTNEAGQFVFRHVWPPKPRDGRYALVFRSKGLATELRSVVRRSDCAEIKLRPAARLMGIVKDRQGKPVDGALVFPFFDRNFLFTPILGIRCAKTDAKGVFVINDLEEYKYVEPNVPVEMRIATHLRPRDLVIQHPDYEGTRVRYTQVPGGMEIELAKGAVITGLVVDGKTGRPVPGLTVSLQGIQKVVVEEERVVKTDQSEKAEDYGTRAQTDQSGRYRLPSLPEGKFNISVWKNPPDFTSAAVDSFEVRQGQTVEAPPIRLVKGGLIKGRLIDDATGKPATLTAGEQPRIGAHGPARPRSGAAIQSTPVNNDGTFEIRLPPGKNWVYVSGKGQFDVVGEPRPFFGHVVHELQVVEGSEYDIEFRITRVLELNKDRLKRSYTGQPLSSRVVVPSDPPGTGAKKRPRTAGGRFAGTVRLEGNAPEPDLRTKRNGSLRINRSADNGIAGVFVYLDKAPSGAAAAVPPPFMLASDVVSFSPREGVIRVGQTLILENDGRKPAYFHLFPYRNPAINHVVDRQHQVNFDAFFTTPEQTPFEIRDDVHAWMRAVLLVVDHPFAAVTNEAGAFEIADLPAGKYSFRVWHERAGFLNKELGVDIRQGETTKRTLKYRFNRFGQ